MGLFLWLFVFKEEIQVEDGRKIMPPSKRKPILYSKIKEYISSGYKMTNQRNFSAVLVRPFIPKTDADFKTKAKWILFDISSFIEYIKSVDIPYSKINIFIDMYGDIEITEEAEE